MNWTTGRDIVLQVQKLWDRGKILAGIAGGESIFPRRLVLKKPDSTELSECFSEVRGWIKNLDLTAKHYRIVWRNIRHRTLGPNSVPAEVWIDTLEDALALLGRQQDAKRFTAMVELSQETEPGLVCWLAKRPLRGLALAGNWPRLLDVVAWLQKNPRPAIYLRQVDIPGVDSKFIETHRGVLTELYDLVIPPADIDDTARGIGGFCRRYGFRDKPERIRFRVLDSAEALLDSSTDQDISVNRDTFARLNPSVSRVFITENEINFLAFPQLKNSMVIFGAGYGFEILADATWLHTCTIFYWGDIDTHGFAILDQLRKIFPQVVSFLMDRATLLAHRDHWGTEPKQQTRELQRLTDEEMALYEDLQTNRIALQLRLEQERISFARVLDCLGDKQCLPGGGNIVNPDNRYPGPIAEG